MAIRCRISGTAIRAKIGPVIERRMRQATQELAAHVKQKLSNGRRGAVGTKGVGEGYPPHVDTGALRNSVYHTIFSEMVMKNLVGRVGVTKVYGLYLEFGAYVRPKSGKLLAIPWSPEAVRHMRNGGGPRTFPKKLIPIKSKGGAILLVQAIGGKASRMVIHYILTAHATIPAHPFLRPSLAEMTGRIREIFKG